MAGLSREELGALVGLDREAIGRIERGERMNFDNLEPIAAALGVRPADLFLDEGEPVSPIRLPQEIMRVSLYLQRRAKNEPGFLARVLRILKEI